MFDGRRLMTAAPEKQLCRHGNQRQQRHNRCVCRCAAARDRLRHKCSCNNDRLQRMAQHCHPVIPFQIRNLSFVHKLLPYTFSHFSWNFHSFLQLSLVKMYHDSAFVSSVQHIFSRSLIKIFFSVRLTCTCDIPSSAATSFWVRFPK